jgi:hypothetical protein
MSAKILEVSCITTKMNFCFALKTYAKENVKKLLKFTILNGKFVFILKPECCINILLKKESLPIFVKRLTVFPKHSHPNH